MTTRSSVGDAPAHGLHRRALGSVLWLLLAGLGLFLAAAVEGAEPTFAGEWICDWGSFRFEINGQQVMAVAANRNRRIEGKLSPDGRTLDGQWKQSPTFAPPNGAGRAVLTLSADGLSFSGRWGYGNSTESGALNGRRVDGSAAARPAEKDDLAGALLALGSNLKELSAAGKALGAAVKGQTPATQAAQPPVELGNATGATVDATATKPTGRTAAPQGTANAARPLSASGGRETGATGREESVRRGTVAISVEDGAPPDPMIFVSVAPVPLDLGRVRELSGLRAGGSASVLQGGMRVLAGEKLGARLATDLATFPAAEAATEADALTELVVDAAAARDAKARALFNVDAAWQEALLAAAYDDENAAREALEQVNAYLHTAKAAQVSLVSTGQQAKKVAQRAAACDPNKLREQARTNYVQQLKSTRTLLAGPAPATGRWCLVLSGVETNPSKRFRLSGTGPEASAEYDFEDGTATIAARWAVPPLIVPGTPARVSIAVKAAPHGNAVGEIALRLAGGAHHLLLAMAYADPNAGNTRLFPTDTFDFNMPDLPRLIQPAKQGKKTGTATLTLRDQEQFRNFLDLGKIPAELPVKPWTIEASALLDPKRPGQLADVILRVEFGNVVNYRYAWQMVAETDIATAAAQPTAPVAEPEFPFNLDKDRAEEYRFREANQVIIRAQLLRDQQELARENDPKRRAALEWRILNGQSDLQAEKDLVESLRTGETVRTRTPFDDFAHDRFVQGIRENQVRLESFQRAQVSIPRLIALLPAAEQKAAREFAQRQMSPDYLAKMDPTVARQVAEALSNRVQGYWQGEAAKHEEQSIKYDDYIQRAQTVKLITNVTTLVGGLGAPSPSLVAQIMLSSAEGYVEGGPAGAVQEAVAYYSAPLYATAEAFKAYPEGGFYGAASAGAIGFVKSKLAQLGVAPGAQAAAKSSRLTVKQLFASAEFKQAQSRGRALVDDFQRGVKELTDARAAGRSIPEVRALERAVMEKAAVAHSDIHAKAFLKYKADPSLQNAFTGQVDAIHHGVEARFHELMAEKNWNPQRLRPVRNASSAGTVGMDFDIMLVEDAATQLVKGGRPASVNEWQREATQQWAQAYKQITGRDAGHALENVTTSLHPEAYKDLAWIGLRNGPVDPAWARQAGDITRYKASEMLKDAKIGGLDYYTRLYEAARGTEKDIRTKLLPQLNSVPPMPPGGTPDQVRKLQERYAELRLRWGRIQGVLDDVGKGRMDPIHADHEMRQLTGGYSIPQVIDHAGILLGELGRAGS